MPLFPTLTSWLNGDTVTHTHLNEVLTKIRDFLNTTKIDSLNIVNGGVSLAKLATQYSTFVHTFTVAPTGGGPLLLADYQGYATDHMMIYLPYEVEIKSISCFSPSTVLGNVWVMMFNAANPGGIPLSDILCGNPVAYIANSAIVLPANSWVSIRVSGLLAFAELPLYYTIVGKIKLQA